MPQPLRSDTPSNAPVRVRLTEAERERVKEAARLNRQNLSAFMRDALVTAADDCLEKAEA
jgi:uncharacterized protein (DUF1778 family)